MTPIGILLIHAVGRASLLIFFGTGTFELVWPFPPHSNQQVMLAISIIMVAMVLFVMGEVIGVFANRLDPFNDPRHGSATEFRQTVRDLFDVFRLGAGAVTTIGGATVRPARIRKKHGR
jgi:hypothetical protein